MDIKFIPDDYCDEDTVQLLFNMLDNSQIEYIKNNEDMHKFLIKKWRNIVNSFPASYIYQYKSENTQQNRNNWFKRYLEYPTKDMAQMPEVL